MGTDFPKIQTDGEGPKRLVTLSDFLIDKYEVSNDEYRKFVDNTGYRTESEYFGWSFVFESAVPAHLKAKITQAVLGAEWWLPVNGSYWREPEGPGSHHRYVSYLLIFQHREYSYDIVSSFFSHITTRYHPLLIQSCPFPHVYPSHQQKEPTYFNPNATAEPSLPCKYHGMMPWHSVDGVVEHGCLPKLNGNLLHGVASLCKSTTFSLRHYIPGETNSCPRESIGTC